MSAQESWLSSYGIDVVVASTQPAINATIKQYIHEFGKGASPTFTAYFVTDHSDNIVQVPDNFPLVYPLIANHTALYGGLDPLTTAAWTGSGTKPDAINTIQQLIYQNTYGTVFPTMPVVSAFKYAVSFELGFPGGTIPPTDIVQLSDDGQFATYKLCFQNLTLVVASYVADTIEAGISGYEVYKQKATAPYEFTVRVPLASINDSSNAPADVAAQAAALGNAFTMQQLVLDLDNASWYGQPVITDAPATSEVYKLLSTVFLPLFAKMMAENGRAALGFNFIPNTATGSTNFGVTSITLVIDDCLGNPGPAPAVATLDYLCSVNGNPPQQFADFSDFGNQYNNLPFWNWFDQVPSVHGVIAVSPQALGNYFATALMDYVKSNCYFPTTSWYFNDDKEMWMVNTPGVQAGQTPTVTVTDGYSSPWVTFSYTSPSGSGYSKNNYSQTQQLTSTFKLTVAQGAGNTLVVTQELVIFYELQMGSTAKGNVVDTVITDTYTLATDNFGKFAPAVLSGTQDKSQNVSFGSITNFFDGDPNTMLATIKSWAQTLVAKNVTDVPVSIMQGLVFPGGNAFAINDFSFSDGGDLIANINYAIPSYITN